LLQEIGIETYCPTRTEIRQWSDRKKKVEAVLFTSYVFLKVNLSDFEKILDLQGVVNFVFYLGKPAQIKEKEIQAIKIFLEQATDYEIQFHRNDSVLIQDGPLAGRTGIIETMGKTTLRVRIEQLGMSLIAHIHRNKVKHTNEGKKEHPAEGRNS
jgi:transcription antitermination factor NusG